MIKKNLLFFLLLLPVIVGGVRCVGEGENRSTATSIAVIGNRADMGGCVMNLSNAVLAAPELAGKLKVDDCIEATFTINYSNQPSDKYYTATEISYVLLNNDSVIVKTGDMIDDHNDSVKSIALNTSPYYNGNIFVQINREEVNNHLYDYDLIFNPDSIDENGIHTVFLKSKKEDKMSGSQTNSNLETFNLRSLFAAYGKDSLYQSGGIEQRYRYVSLNFKHQSGVKEGIPVYSRSGNKPVDIYIFN
ncbi:MAG: hypothetical protein LBP72_07890 [Dysgonamonadaceae bacterium]|jgi:hypothetical protein|nr:hypothetical protein [Dysgonamonadaceae bacterium]